MTVQLEVRKKITSQKVCYLDLSDNHCLLFKSCCIFIREVGRKAKERWFKVQSFLFISILVFNSLLIQGVYSAPVQCNFIQKLREELKHQQECFFKSAASRGRYEIHSGFYNVVLNFNIIIFFICYQQVCTGSPLNHK